MKTIYISDESGAMLDRLVASGEYENEQEVLEVSLRLLAQLDREDVSEERKLVAEGIADYQSGNFGPFDADEIKAMGRKLRAKRLGGD